jgi:hypothetical protein
VIPLLLTHTTVIWNERDCLPLVYRGKGGRMHRPARTKAAGKIFIPMGRRNDLADDDRHDSASGSG